MAGLWSWLFRRRKTLAVAELPRAVPSGRPTSVQIAKQLVARPETAVAESAEAAPAEVLGSPRGVEAAEHAPDEPVQVAPDEPVKVAPDETEPDAPDEPEPERREISPERLDQALRRLREEIPASEDGAPSATPAED